MKKYFVVSDIHNFYSFLIEALNNKGFDQNDPDHVLIVCGDAFDRANEAIKVLGLLTSLHQQQRLIYIKGNHEFLLKKCYQEILEYGGVTSKHHISNGTRGTICQLVGPDIERKIMKFLPLDPEENALLAEKMQSVFELIDTCINYYEMGDYIFVHGWLPKTPAADYLYYGPRKTGGIFNPEWRNAGIFDWEEATWLNGMEEWEDGIREPGKTIICGHWHCSWGNTYLHDKYEEWPPKEDPDFLKAFEPFIDDGIIAIDACAAYSGKINVLVFEESDNHIVKMLDI